MTSEIDRWRAAERLLFAIMDDGGSATFDLDGEQMTRMQANITKWATRKNRAVAFDGTTVTIGPPTRARHVSPERKRIEQMQPGDVIELDTEFANVDNYRRILLAVRKQLGSLFSYREDAQRNVLRVMRVDGLAPGTKVTMREQSRYPFEDLEVGETREMEGGNIESVRSMAQYHKKRYGKHFTVSNKEKVIAITRVK